MLPSCAQELLWQVTPPHLSAAERCISLRLFFLYILLLFCLHFHECADASTFPLSPTPHVACAVLGTEDDNGNFLVQDCELCYAGIPPPPPPHGLSGQLLFVSGLRLGGSASDAGAQLLLEWLAGFCGSVSGSISACVVLGNCCAFRSVAFFMFSHRVSSITNSKLAAFHSFVCRKSHFLQRRCRPTGRA